MALNNAIINGLDPFNPPSAQSATTAQSAQPTAPNVDPDLIEVPADATPQQKAYVEYINKITDVDTLKKCAVLGMVPEDSVAQRYLTEVSFEKMKSAYYDDKLPVAVKSSFEKDVLESEIPLRITSSISSSKVIEDLLTKTNLKGIDLEYLQDNLIEYFDNFSMGVFINPIETINKDSPLLYPEEFFSDILLKFHIAYSNYTTNEYAERDDKGNIIKNKYATNLGYFGADPDEYAKRYDPKKEGMIRYLNKLAESTDNLEVKAKAKELADNYDELMRLVGGSYSMLYSVLHSNEYREMSKLLISSIYSTKEGFDNLFSTTNSKHEGLPFIDYEDISPWLAKTLCKAIDTNSDKLADFLAKECKNPEQVFQTLLKINNSSDNSKIKIMNQKGTSVAKTIDSSMLDLSYEGLNVSKPILDVNTVTLAYYKFLQKQGLYDENSSAQQQQFIQLLNIKNVTSRGDPASRRLLYTQSLQSLTELLDRKKALEKYGNISFEDYKKNFYFS